MPTYRQLKWTSAIVWTLVLLTTVATAVLFWGYDVSWSGEVGGGVGSVLVLAGGLLDAWKGRQKKREEEAAAEAAAEQLAVMEVPPGESGPPPPDGLLESGPPRLSELLESGLLRPSELPADVRQLRDNIQAALERAAYREETYGESAFSQPSAYSQLSAYSQSAFGQSASDQSGAFSQPSAYSQSAFGQPLSSEGQMDQTSYWNKDSDITYWNPSQPPAE